MVLMPQQQMMGVKLSIDRSVRVAMADSVDELREPTSGLREGEATLWGGDLTVEELAAVAQVAHLHALLPLKQPTHHAVDVRVGGGWRR